MKTPKWMMALTVLTLIATAATAQDKPKIALDAPGTFVRIATTPDGWVTLGYRLANETVGDEWMLLEVMLAVPDGTKEHTIKRTDIALVMPGPKVVQLATQEEFQKANYLRSLNRRAEITKDPINYVPNNATRSRPLSLFGAPNLPGIAALATEQFDVTDRMAAYGRLFFHIPGGIQEGQHQLDVVFANSTVQCPFRIVGSDKDKIKELEEKIKEIKKGAKK